MQTLCNYLRNELKEIENIQNQVQKQLIQTPNGHLKIKERNRKTEYYYVDSKTNNNKEKYIRKKDMSLANKLAQRDYDKIILNKARQRSKAIARFVEEYEKTDLKKVFHEMHPRRRELLSNAILSDQEYISLWESEEYERKGYDAYAKEIITERGERVRSKSEKIIADKLLVLGIPYRYEYPLVLDNGITIYPDFTILKMPSREEVYLEHLGMMDDMDYVEKAMYRFNSYERNGIYLNINLFITYETSRAPLNTKSLDAMLRHLFCEE